MVVIIMLSSTLNAEGISGKGAIKGKISPAENIKLILKKSGTDYKKPKNVKGEIVLKQGGEFVFENLDAGKYTFRIKDKPP